MNERFEKVNKWNVVMLRGFKVIGILLDGIVKINEIIFLLMFNIICYVICIFK